MQIVIGWTEQDFNVVSTDGIDLGKAPKIEYFEKAKTALWLNNGTVKDIEAAQKYVNEAGEGKKVIVFKKNVKNPLELAKKQLLTA